MLRYTKLDRPAVHNYGCQAMIGQLLLEGGKSFKKTRKTHNSTIAQLHTLHTTPVTMYWSDLVDNAWMASSNPPLFFNLASCLAVWRKNLCCAGEATDCLPSRTKSPSSGGERSPLRHTVACESTARTRSAHLFAGSYTIISLMSSLSPKVWLSLWLTCLAYSQATVDGETANTHFWHSRESDSTATGAVITDGQIELHVCVCTWRFKGLCTVCIHWYFLRSDDTFSVSIRDLSPFVIQIWRSDQAQIHLHNW